MSAPINAPFGRMLTAMVTPFKKSGELDWSAAEKIAAHLVATGHDGIVLNGTTGEAPTTSDDEKDELIKVVRKVVGEKIKIIAGAGNNETSHSVEQAKRAAKAGADGLLVVSPYYNRPPQAGVYAHFKAMADATDLSIILYDIPKRTGVEIETDTICKLAEHPKVAALKDAKGDPAATSQVIKRSQIPVYSGDDILNLILLSVGAVRELISPRLPLHQVLNDRLIRSVSDWFAGTLCVRLLGKIISSPIFIGNRNVALLKLLNFSHCRLTSLCALLRN